MNNMDVKLKTYYDNADEFTKRLIDWCCIANHEITEQKMLELKPIEDNDIDYLDKNIKELDGTLLVDIVFKFMRTHKIFI